MGDEYYISQLKEEIVHLTHAKDEAIKWYEDACKKLEGVKDRLLTVDEIIKTLLHNNEGMVQDEICDYNDVAKAIYKAQQDKMKAER